MQALGQVLAAATRDPAADFWYGPTGSGVVQSVARVQGDGILHVPAVYACTTIISEDIGKSPAGMYEDLGEGGRAPARQHELQAVLHDQPNRYQDAIEYKEMVTAFALLEGLAVSEIRPAPGKVVGELIPLHPWLVREEVAKPSGTRRYIYRDPLLDFAERTILDEDAFVLRGKLSRGIRGLASESLGLELAAERYALFMFTRGSKHQGVISHPKLLTDPLRRAIRKGLDEYAIDGPRAGRPLLLEDGMTWHDVSIANRDMEFLAQRQFGVTQICRWFRMPPHKIAALERSTNNNIEQQSIDYVTDTLLGWVIRWEQAIRRDLLSPRDQLRFFAKLNLDALLRGNLQARFEAYALAVQWGWMTRNEVREKEDMNPLDGLGDPLTPLNMQQGPDGTVALQYGDQQRALADPAVRGQLRILASDAASRVIRREVAAVSKLAERSANGTFASGVEAFYAEHADHVASTLHIPDHVARQYARDQRRAVMADGIDATDDWLTERVEFLTTLAMNGPEAAAA